MPNGSIQDEELINQIKSLPKDFLDELKNEVNQNREIEKRKKKFLKNFIPLAAACILAVVYVSFFMEIPNYSKEYLVSNKIQNNIVLPDDSKISLDANTSINIKYYKNKRLVELSRGKAIFDVTSNKEQPFIIQTDRINVKVLGTKFEVVNFDDLIQVNVLEGIVRVSKTKDETKELAIVNKGESLVLDKNADLITQKSTNIAKLLQWSEGKYTFQQTTLQEVLNEFSKHLDLNITFEKQNLKNYPISGNFDVNHFDDFLKVLPMIHPIKVVKSDRNIIIK
jgi:transmembrane sensor